MAPGVSALDEEEEIGIDVIIEDTPYARKRFSKKVEKASGRWLWIRGRRTSECWLWTGGRNNKGYAMFAVGRLMKLAHRVAFEWATKRSLLASDKVLHKCDTPLCVRPLHLFTGTQKNNVDDMCEKRRGPDGERNPHAKLTWESAAEIREAYENSDVSQQELANRYGVHRATIAPLVRGETWREFRR